MALLDFWRSHGSEFAQLLRQHAVLVLVSTALAALVGIPLGVLAARRPRLGQALLTVVSVAQTIPSLALLGFLLPLPLVGGVGPRTALVALFLYALLPIVRSTTTGLLHVDPAAREAALAVGMTSWQRLRMVELPLALAAVMTGLRLATVIGVGTATVAAAVGAGGLGEYIFRGLAMVDATMILAGAVPAALVALLADALLARMERHLTRRRGRSPRAALVLLIVGVVAAVVASASASPDFETIVVGSKNTTEQVLLGEIVAQLIEAEHATAEPSAASATDKPTGSPERRLQVQRRLNLGGTFVCDAGLRSGAIDLYVEYTGTSLSAIFREPVSRGSAEVLARVRERYAAAGITVLEPFGFNNTFAILVRGEDARRHGWRTIDDLASSASTLRPGFGHEFLEREDGYRGLLQAYGLRFVNQPRGMELSLIYRALADGEVDFIAGDATSALIERFDLVPLADSRRYFPPYDAVPIARSVTLLRYPLMRRALARLSGRITDADMRAMNAAVDVERQDPRAVARKFVAMLDR
jgi:osmoprotectant transport system permease protein